MQTVKLIARFVYRLANDIASFAFAAMFVLIVIQVFWRYWLNMPLSWPEEAARTCFLWLSYLGLVTVVRNKEAYRIEYFVDRFPPIAKLLCGLVVDASSIFFFVLVLLGTWPVLAANWGLTTSISTPVNILYATAPIAAVLIIPLVLKSLREQAARLLSASKDDR